jgi:arsenate reductase
MKTVLFICVHNSGRSQMAEAFFNCLAGGKAKAISAGTQPSKAVNAIVVKVMLEVGLDISHNKPKLLTSEMLDRADRVITMGCMDASACPARLVDAEDWGMPDPEGKTLAEVINIRDEIKRRVSRLLDEL